MSSSSRDGANSEALWLAFPVQVTLSRIFFFFFARQVGVSTLRLAIVVQIGSLDL